MDHRAPDEFRIRVELEATFTTLCCRAVVLETREGVGTIAPRIGESRIKLCCFATRSVGGHEVPFGIQRTAKVDVRNREVGLQLDGLPERAFRIIEALLLYAQLAHVGMGKGI